MCTDKLIEQYFAERGLKRPTMDQALKFVITELGEVYEILLARDGGWVRNNPDKKIDITDEALEEEIGDAIMMLQVAGSAQDLNPIMGLHRKINRKLAEVRNAKASTS